MRLVFLAAMLLAGGDARATDCPTPPKLTCEQLKEKIAQRCPKETATAAVGFAVVPCAHPPCPPPLITVNCPECKPVTVEKYTVIEKPAVPRGNWFAGAGPLYIDAWGATAAVGYKWANGWMLMGGPTWLDRQSYSGSVTNCTNGGGGPGNHGCPCVTLPYSVDARSAWGGTALLLYNFK